MSEGASPQPQPVELAEIEAGRVPDNTHLEIGPHWIMGHELVFRYTNEGEFEEDTESELPCS